MHIVAKFQLLTMIYLIDSTEFKVIFDKSDDNIPYALPKTEQERLKDIQVEFLMKGFYPPNSELKVHPFKSVDKKIDGKDCVTVDTDTTIDLNPKNVFWKVIFREEQEKDKFVEIF